MTTFELDTPPDPDPPDPEPQPGTGALEFRSWDGPVEVREDAKDGPVISGYAAVFEALSLEIGPVAGFRERIEPHAFTGVLRSKPDVRALFNHDPNRILGRTLAKTLELRQDAHGLHYTIKPPKTREAEDVMELIRTGHVSGSSFAFVVPKGGDEITQDKDGMITRSVKRVAELRDVSPVTYPAYPQTEATVRSIYSLIETRTPKIVPTLPDPPPDYQWRELELRERQLTRSR